MRIIITARKVFKLKYKQYSAKHGISIEYMYETLYDVNGEDVKVKAFCIDADKYILGIEIKK